VGEGVGDGADAEHDECVCCLGAVEAVGAADGLAGAPVEGFVAGVVDSEFCGGEYSGAVFAECFGERGEG